jgi:hypothetical protein
MKWVWVVLGAVVLLVSGGIAGAVLDRQIIQPPAAASKSTTASTAAPSTTTTASTTSTSSPTSKRLPITVSKTLSTPTVDPSILLPISCTVAGTTVTATGTFSGSFVPESYIRLGAAVELYVYTTSSTNPTPSGTQLGELASEKAFVVPDSGGSWQVSVPIGIEQGAPTECRVAIQQTHAFMGAGNAGG